METQIKICVELKPFRECKDLDESDMIDLAPSTGALEIQQELDENDNVIEKDEFGEELAEILKPFSPMERLNILRLYHFKKVYLHDSF